ncbi:MAG: hypothetical protein WCJ94_02860 [bacterium]
MAQNEKEKKNSPKDITPNSKSGAEKNNAVPTDYQASESDSIVGKENEDATSNSSFFDSRTVNRILQFMLIVIGLFGLFLGFKGQEFMPLPAAIGMLAFVLATLLEAYIGKIFKNEDQMRTMSTIALSGVFGALLITYIGEIFKKFDLPANKLILTFVIIAVAVVMIIQAIFYMMKNKDKFIADIEMLLATILSFTAALLFFYYFAIPSFILVAVSLILIIMSITKDSLKDDGRLNGRLTVITANILVFLLILAYASTIFFHGPIDVTLYGKITPAYKSKPANLAWSGDSWSFAYNIFDSNSKDSSVNIMNSLSIGINSLPPVKNQEVVENNLFFALPISKEKKLEAEANLTESKVIKPEDKVLAEAVEGIKLPQYLDAPIFNNKGNYLIFSGGDTKDGSRNIWGVSLTLTLLEMEANKKDKEKEANLTQDERVNLNAKKREELDRNNMPVGKLKVVIADINKIIDMECKPLTHKTAWAPNGKDFTFSAVDTDGVYNIWSSNSQEQTIDKVTKGDSKIMPLWSPKGDKILYVTKIDSYTYLKIADEDGNNGHELNLNNKKDKALFPLWNAAESKVIYIKKGNLIIMNASATEPRTLGRDSLTPSPYWLTDKKKKVTLNFTESENIWRIWTINPDGKKNKEIFVEACESLSQPKWSYDGEAIVTAANYKTESCLWRLNKDGDFKTRLYTSKHEISELEWAPTSERIAFIVKKKAVQSAWFDSVTNLEELWVINNDGTKPMNQYQATGNIKHMSWDDEGNRLAFDETYQRIYFQPMLTVVKIVHAIGGEKWDLLPYEFYGESPTWSNDGDIIAYIAWKNFWVRSLEEKDRLWVAQLK